MPNESNKSDTDVVTTQLNLVRVEPPTKKSLWRKVEQYLEPRTEWFIAGAITLVILFSVIIIYVFYPINFQRSKDFDKQVYSTPNKPAKPVDEIVKPVDEPAKPIDEPVKPVDEPVKPVDEPVKPVDEPVKPVDEPAKPLTRKSVQSSREPQTTYRGRVKAVEGVINIVSLAHNVKQKGQNGLFVVLNIKLTQRGYAECRLISVVLTERSLDTPDLYNYWQENPFVYDSVTNNNLYIFIPYASIYKGLSPHRFSYVARLFVKIKGYDTQVRQSLYYPFKIANNYAEF